MFWIGPAPVRGMGHACTQSARAFRCKRMAATASDFLELTGVQAYRPSWSEWTCVFSETPIFIHSFILGFAWMLLASFMISVPNGRSDLLLGASSTQILLQMKIELRTFRAEEVCP